MARRQAVNRGHPQRPVNGPHLQLRMSAPYANARRLLRDDRWPPSRPGAQGRLGLTTAPMCLIGPTPRPVAGESPRKWVTSDDEMAVRIVVR